MTTTQDRLDYLRSEIKGERISYEEISELQSLAEHIDDEDTLLLEWAGVPESTCTDCERRTADHACTKCGAPLCERCAGRDSVGAEIHRRHGWTIDRCAQCM